MGLGMLVISNQLIEGYGLTGQISGTQQKQMRGGTENVPSVAASVAAVASTFENRSTKNKKMLKLKKQIIFGIEQELQRGSYKMYFAKKKPTENEFIVLGPECNGSHINPNILPNTLLFSFVKNKEFENKEYKPFCNINIKKELDKKNIIISIGSACSTSDAKASHVLYSIKAPDKIKQGVLRVSLSDNTTSAEVSTFVTALLISLHKQMPF
jgi:cysteine sulfinate desulfinase/cysteine desulfurase-like protein